jgi:hypothetical protein
MTAGIAGHRLKAFILAAVAHIVDKGPGAIERGGAKVIFVP